MGVNVNTFSTILHPFSVEWNSSTITRSDVNPHGEPQVAWRSLDAAGALGLVLEWICSTMTAYSLQQLFGITPAVCSRYLSDGLNHLLTSLRKLKHARMVWPSTERAIQPLSEAIEKNSQFWPNALVLLMGWTSPYWFLIMMSKLFGFQCLIPSGYWHSMYE